MHVYVWVSVFVRVRVHVWLCVCFAAGPERSRSMLGEDVDTGVITHPQAEQFHWGGCGPRGCVCVFVCVCARVLHEKTHCKSEKQGKPTVL